VIMAGSTSAVRYAWREVGIEARTCGLRTMMALPVPATYMAGEMCYRTESPIFGSQYALAC
jgi:hypothetical protein